jgi:hypothetical protein
MVMQGDAGRLGSLAHKSRQTIDPLLWTGLLTLAALTTATATVAWLFGSTEVRGSVLAASLLLATTLIAAAGLLANRWATPERFLARYSEAGRRSDAFRTAIPIFVLSGVWCVGGVLGDVVSNGRTGFGTLQAIVLLVGCLGFVSGVLTWTYLRHLAPVWLPFVASSSSSAVESIRGLQVASPDARRYVFGGGNVMEILPTPSSDDQSTWHEADRLVTLSAIHPTAVLMFDRRRESPTRGVTNLVHLAFGCAQGCPPLLGIPEGVSFAVVSIGRQPGATAMVTTASASPSNTTAVRMRKGPDTYSDAVRRNISGRELVELTRSRGWPLGGRARHVSDGALI